jgi:hypothetical protein
MEHVWQISGWWLKLWYQWICHKGAPHFLALLNIEMMIKHWISRLMEVSSGIGQLTIWKLYPNYIWAVSTIIRKNK